MTTIAAADVSPAAAPLPAFDAEAAVQSLLVSPVEAAHRLERPLVGRTDLHPLVQAAYMAYTERHPLVLSPDVVWFCLARGFTLHLAANEALRSQILGAGNDDSEFVLTIHRPDFALGAASPWPQSFPDLSRQIASRLGNLWELTAAQFSTTGPVERLASELTVATPFAPHFVYEPPFPGDRVFPERGIPGVHLLGGAEDWRWVRRRAAMFGAFRMEPWTDMLLPVLDRIVHSAEGHADTLFWRSFFRYENGADELTGWIHLLFPYLQAPSGDHFVPNPHLDGWFESWEEAENREDPVQALGNPRGSGLAALPPGLASASVRFIDAERREYPLDLVGGLVGVTQDPRSLALVPEFGWALVHDEGAEPAQA